MRTMDIKQIHTIVSMRSLAIGEISDPLSNQTQMNLMYNGIVKSYTLQMHIPHPFKREHAGTLISTAIPSFPTEIRITPIKEM